MLSQASRSVVHYFTAPKTTEGAGFPIQNVIGSRKLDKLDPFLLVHHMGPVTYGPGEAKGAPWHPHRGFETITYLLQGEMEHKDSMGNFGKLRAGDVQFMTAGSGVIHDELPSPDVLKKGGVIEGFQIWVNLPKKYKMCVPNYQDVPKEKIIEIQHENYLVRVLSGEAFGSVGVAKSKTDIQFLDFQLKAGASITHKFPKDWNSCVYVYRGDIYAGKVKTPLLEGQIAVFDVDGDSIDVSTTNGGRFIFLAGKPINEPIARHGPFVMNTQEEIVECFKDYQEGKLVRHKGTMEYSTNHQTEYDPNTAKIV